ncbi:hypothetical protein E3P89_03389 [Wallemia ichthyophaga]|uniref:Magnesium transporter protein 1 n=1 Tax=Wallemia ichthyophaga TaxID=245174 RepID=A0A4T0H228_WALIC|nr:hypothetical protein E3P93_03372 [Wallemia ichthyophaga]TIB09186.1 hypothetical protein E3P90_03371 [Wallemia ichthyophaga]TIB20133.1 hypothetical protein E3P89_03389 [Wallemia ichthyophaga]TIB21702.1 hypothetical protein E3P88_03384 [Wallemia ichthyophaga]
MPFIFIAATIISTVATIAPAISAISVIQHDAQNQAGVVKLDDLSYNELIRTPERDFGVAVVLTAMDERIKCTPCHKFAPEFHLLAKQAKGRRSTNKNSIVFASLDFMDGQRTFNDLGLNTAPSLFYHPPHELNGHLYDFNRNGFLAERLVAFLNTHSPTKFAFKRPVDHTSTVIALVLLTILAVFAKKNWNTLTKPFIFSKWSWCMLTLIIILTMTSGYMWNQIRKPPQMVMTKNGAQYFANGVTNQYRAETVIIGTIYALLASTIVILTISVPKIQNTGRQRAAAYLWTLILIVTFSVLVYIFKMKQPIYPFRLFV